MGRQAWLGLTVVVPLPRRPRGARGVKLGVHRLHLGYTDSATRRTRVAQRTIKAVIRQGEESGYVAECLEIPVVTQGKTLDEVTRNLQEAVALHLADEDLAALGLDSNPTVVVTMELLPAHA